MCWRSKKRIEQIDPGGITERAEDVDRIVGPERDAIGEILDVGDVKREIAQIVRRLNLEVVPIHPQEPAERSNARTSRRRCRPPTPRNASDGAAEEGQSACPVSSGAGPASISATARGGGTAAIFARRKTASCRPTQNRRRETEKQSQAGKAFIEPAAHDPEQQTGHRGDVDESQSRRKNLHLGTGPCL